MQKVTATVYAFQLHISKHYKDTIDNFDNIDRNKNLLNEFISKSMGKKLVIVLLPPGHWISDDYVSYLSDLGFHSPGDIVCDKTLHSTIKDFLENITVIDMQDYLCNGPKANDYYFDYDGHLTAEGSSFCHLLLNCLKNPRAFFFEEA